MLDNKFENVKQVVYSTYGDIIDFGAKKKNLVKFGRRTTVGTDWETLMSAQGTETEETFVSGNDITTVVSSSALDNGKTLKLEYHVLNADGSILFGVQDVTLDGADATTPVTLDVPCFRVSRLYNTSTSDSLVGNIYVYEGGIRTDANTHLVIVAGENQTQKTQTTTSSEDYWVISNFSVTCLAKVTKYVECRIEAKSINSNVWLPIAQTVGVTDSAGTIQINTEPYLIVPNGYDIRLAVKSNTSGVDVSGGISGYLAKIV